MVVVGIGQCCWDTVALVETYPQMDTKAEAKAWLEEGGGPTATALVSLARWGVACRFCGVIGDDPAGERIRAGLLSEGVDARLTVRHAAHSQRAAIIVEQGGHRTIIWQRPGGAPLQLAELPNDLLSGAHLLLLDGLMPEVSMKVARVARDRGLPVVLDAGRDRPGMRALAAVCTHVVAAEQYAFDLGWDGTANGFSRLAEQCGYPVFTVTCGVRGSYTWASSGSLVHVPAFPVVALDTTGAGDVFHGGYGYGLLQGWELPRIIRFASAAAALKCRQLGGRQGIPGLADLHAFMAQSGKI
jgi:ribokinase